jgi:hypothetical protein
MAGLFEVATTKEEVTKPEIEEPEIAFTIELPLSAHFSFNSSKNPTKKKLELFLKFFREKYLIFMNL